MRTRVTLLPLLLAALGPASAHGQDKPWELVGELVSIEDGDDKPVRLANVRLTVREFLRKGTTDDQGLFVIQMPAAAKPGVPVTLLHDKAGYEVFFPYRGSQSLPAVTTPPVVVEVRMLPKGSKRWWTDSFIDAHVEHERSRSAERLPKPPEGRFDSEASLRELAGYAGFTEGETREQLTGYIERARKDAADRNRQANAAFLARNYRLAGELYLKVADDLEGAGAEQIRLGAYKREAAGEAFFNALDFARALATYQDATKRLVAYQATREALNLGDYPESATDRKRLAFKEANARVNLADRVEGSAITRHMDEAIAAYRKLLDEVPRSADPGNWAMTQDNLGTALGRQAGRSEGPRAAELLGEAVAAHRSALQVRTRDQLPQDWAMTQDNLGAALRDLAARSEGPRAAELLGEAVAAHRSALQVYTRDQLPQHWAATQNNLGEALRRQAGRSEGPRAAELLGEAVAAHRSALQVYTRDQLPQGWAMTQRNLGISLQDFFAANEFRAALEQLKALEREKGLSDDPQFIALLDMLRVLCHEALNEGDRTAQDLDAFIAHVERQPEDFRIDWDVSRLRRVVERSDVEAIAAHREFLLGVLDATAKGRRDDILSGLRWSQKR